MSLKQSFDIQEKIKANEQKRRLLYVENCYYLKGLYESEDYKKLLGDETGTWLQFLSSANISYTPFQIKCVIQVIKKLEECGVEPDTIADILGDISMSRMNKIKSLLTPENVEDWLSMAKTLSYHDLMMEMKKAQGIPVDNHEHTNELFEICTLCYEKKKVNKE